MRGLSFSLLEQFFYSLKGCKNIPSSPQAHVYTIKKRFPSLSPKRRKDCYINFPIEASVFIFPGSPTMVQILLSNLQMTCGFNDRPHGVTGYAELALSLLRINNCVIQQSYISCQVK